MFERSINHHYIDPVDQIWMRAASDFGLTIERSADAFAAFDGKGTLTIATVEHFDADDCLAQMIFHEICHWLVAGRRGIKLDDWGLSNIDDRDLIYEYAAIRVQAALSQKYGLRDFMAVTTDWRPYWDTLPEDPLAEGNDPAIPLALDAFDLAKQEPFAAVLSRSLSATAAVADAVRGVADSGSLWSLTKPRHRLGALLSDDTSLHCGSCAWAFESQSGLACRQHLEPDKPTPSIDADDRACERWERAFTIDDCGSCGACCRQGFEVLEVADGDPFRTKYPELVELRDGEHRVPRPNGLCVALGGDGSEQAPYRCQHYLVRPQNCQDFEVGGDACLLARRRVGVSR
jgi:hypothetical protein